MRIMHFLVLLAAVAMLAAPSAARTSGRQLLQGECHQLVYWVWRRVIENSLQYLVHAKASVQQCML